jgi:cysteine-rich repeat protein
VTITSALEDGVVSDVYPAVPSWIGASDDANDTDMVFDWVTDEAWGYTSFAPSEPDDDAGLGGNGECLFADAAGNWGDTNCNITAFVAARVCEFEVDTCGDGIVQAVNDETCDDGNTSGGDGCNATCELENVCGNGVTEGAEECDDDNTVSGDGCSATCIVETLFFSEYVEGTSNNKALEIRNPFTTAVNLATSNCQIRAYFNGNVTSTNLTLTGTIGANDVYLVCNSLINAAVTPNCDQLVVGGATNFNGDDALELVCGGTTLDVIGQIGFDPGTNWGAGLTSTVDHTLRRKCAITNGDTVGTDVFDPATEWGGFAVDTFGDLGLPGCSP